MWAFSIDHIVVVWRVCIKTMYSHAVIKLHTHTCLDKDSQWERFLNIGWKLGDKLKPWITAHIPNCRFFFHLSTFLHSNLEIIGKRGKANFPSQVCAMYVFRFEENVKCQRRGSHYKQRLFYSVLLFYSW